MKILMRLSSSLKGLPEGEPLVCVSVPSTAAGSGTPQCAVMGWPGQYGHISPAALSQTVNTKSSGRCPGDGELVPALAA